MRVMRVIENHAPNMHALNITYKTLGLYITCIECVCMRGSIIVDLLYTNMLYSTRRYFMAKVKRIVVDKVPDDILRRAKSCAALTGVTMGKFVESALRKAIAEVEQNTYRK